MSLEKFVKDCTKCHSLWNFYAAHGNAGKCLRVIQNHAEKKDVQFSARLYFSQAALMAF